MVKRKSKPRNHCEHRSLDNTATYAVTFLILYLRFMFMPLTPNTIFLQILIIIILLVLSSDPAYFTQKFVLSRIAVLLILAYNS